MTDELIVRREVKIAAPPEVVFDYFTDPEKAARWKGIEATLAPEPGGEYRLNVTGTSIAVGSFVDVDRPRRLVYTWGWEGSSEIPPGSSTVEVNLEADGEYTIVRLTHTGLPTAEACAQHAEGWEHYLARLTKAAAGQDPGPDPWAQRA